MSHLISVIIPVYNVEPYIAECLDSILSQSYRNIEVICVEDCGEDASLSIVESYVERDGRIKLIPHEHNKGPGPARNTGMDAAAGDYIFFIDPDDILEQDCLKRLLAEAEKSGADITVGMFEAFADDEGNREETRRAANTNRQRNEYDNTLLTITDKNFFEALNGQSFAVWGKLFRREFIEGAKIRFMDANVCHEDIGFHLMLLVQGATFFLSDIPAIRYRIRNTSIIGKSDDSDVQRKRSDGRKVLEDTFSFIRKNFNAQEAERYIEKYAQKIH